MKIYTKKGDDGSTGLFYGGRVRKDSTGPEAYGTVDEAVAAIGVARSHADAALSERLLKVQRELFVVAAELATDPSNRHKLEPGVSVTTPAMVSRIETEIDAVVDAVGMPEEFILDLARAIVRRAERRAVTYAAEGGLDGSHVVPYLNRLADYIYMLVRASEEAWQPSRLED